MVLRQHLRNVRAEFDILLNPTKIAPPNVQPSKAFHILVSGPGTFSSISKVLSERAGLADATVSLPYFCIKAKFCSNRTGKPYPLEITGSANAACRRDTTYGAPRALVVVSGLHGNYCSGYGVHSE